MNCFFYRVKFSSVLFAFIGLLFFSTLAKADEVRIGYVNIRKIMVQAPQLKQIQQKLSAEFEDDRQEIINLRNEIAKLSNSYDENIVKPSNAQEDLASQQQNIDDKQLALSKLQQQMQNEYNLRRNEALAKLQNLIVNTVAKVSKEKKLDIVLNNTGVIYVNQRIDITPDVFKSLAEQIVD